MGATVKSYLQLRMHLSTIDATCALLWLQEHLRHADSKFDLYPRPVAMLPRDLPEPQPTLVTLPNTAQQVKAAAGLVIHVFLNFVWV